MAKLYVWPIVIVTTTTCEKHYWKRSMAYTCSKGNKCMRGGVAGGESAKSVIWADLDIDKREGEVEKVEERERERRKEGQKSNIKWEVAWQAFFLLLQPMGIPIKHLLSRPPPIISILLGLIYHMTPFCKLLLLGQGRRGWSLLRLPSAPRWLLGDFARKVPNTTTAFSLTNKSKMGPDFQPCHQTVPPLDYVAPLCECGEREPVQAGE